MERALARESAEESVIMSVAVRILAANLASLGASAMVHLPKYTLVEALALTVSHAASLLYIV